MSHKNKNRTFQTTILTIVTFKSNINFPQLTGYTLKQFVFKKLVVHQVNPNKNITLLTHCFKTGKYRMFIGLKILVK